jgi:hypothetical protein
MIRKFEYFVPGSKYDEAYIKTALAAEFLKGEDLEKFLIKHKLKVVKKSNKFDDWVERKKIRISFLAKGIFYDPEAFYAFHLKMP